MKFYFKLQSKRILRIIEEAGFNPSLIIGLALVSFIALSYVLFQEVEYANFIYPFLPLSLLNGLRNKERNEFVKLAFSKKQYLQIRVMENALIVLPFLMYLLYKQEFLISIILSGVSILFAFVNTRSSFTFVIPTPFSKHPFEFIIGFRKTFLGLIGSLLLMGVAIQVDNFNLAVFALIIPFLISMSFYSKPEPLFYVWMYSKTATQFLWHKILLAVKNSLVLSFIQVCIISIFFPDQILIIGIAVLIGCLFVIMNLLGKYANYPSDINVMQGFAIMFSVFFPPFALIVIPFFYSKSKQTLQYILDDKN